MSCGSNPAIRRYLAASTKRIEAVEAAGIAWSVIPGITAASAASAAIGQSLTRRTAIRASGFITGHDMQGFAEHDWRALARPGSVAAIYMGKRAARFLQGRMLMHGGAGTTPVTSDRKRFAPGPENCRGDARHAGRTPDRSRRHGPALILYGLAPRAAEVAARQLQKELA